MVVGSGSVSVWVFVRVMSDDIRIPESEASFHRCNAKTLRGIDELRAIASRMRAERRAKANGSESVDVSTRPDPTPDEHARPPWPWRRPRPR